MLLRKDTSITGNKAKRMGKKSKRRGGGKSKECSSIFQQIADRIASDKVFQKHKDLVNKRLQVAALVGVLDEYRFAFDRLFVRVAAAAESIDGLPDRVLSIDDDVSGALKEQSHDFINTSITDKMRKHLHFTTLSAWCKIVILTCHYALHLASHEALVPLFDRDAADLLRQVSSNDDEPMSLRTMAMVARATIMFRNHNDLNEASYRRRANSYFVQIVDSEYPLVSGADGVIGDLLSAAMGIATPDYLSLFSSVVTGIVSMSNDRLTALEGPPRLPQLLADGVDNMSSEQMGYIANFANSVGGAFCDNCLKSREDASVVNFFKCSRCRLAHYCSRDCQKKAWDAEHRKHCRKAGCFNIGDLVTFEDVVKGRRHSTVVEKCEDSSLLKCKIMKAKEVEVIDKKAKDLRHIRPLDFFVRQSSPSV